MKLICSWPSTNFTNSRHPQQCGRKIYCKGAIALNGHKFRTIPCFPAVSVASRLVNIKFNKGSSVFWYILMFHECCGSVIWYTKLNCQYIPNKYEGLYSLQHLHKSRFIVNYNTNKNCNWTQQHGPDNCLCNCYFC